MDLFQQWKKYKEARSFAALSAGSKRAWEEIYSDYAPKLLYIAHKYQISSEDSNALVKEFAQGIWDHREELADRDSFDEFIKHFVRHNFRKCWQETIRKEIERRRALEDKPGLDPPKEF